MVLPRDEGAGFAEALTIDDAHSHVMLLRYSAGISQRLFAWTWLFFY